MGQLLIVEPFPPRGERTPGMMWRYPEGDIPGRECWWIVLPPSPDQGTPGHPGELSWRTTDTVSDPPHEMWDVSGTPPFLTVTPSIDILRFVRNPNYDFNKKPEEQPGVPSRTREGSYWHGWITNGILVPA